MISDNERVIEEDFKRLLQESSVPVHSLTVLGSGARGDAGPDSDLDILVVVETLDPELRKTISD